MKKPRILVVEDDPSLRQVLEIFLNQMGCEVLTEADGKRALDLVRTLSTPPDMILTDLSLPGLDGLELLEAVRVIYPQLPLVLLTGFQSEMVHSRAIAPDAILEKPLQLSDLKQVMANFLEKKDASA